MYITHYFLLITSYFLLFTHCFLLIVSCIIISCQNFPTPPFSLNPQAVNYRALLFRGQSEPKAVFLRQSRRSRIKLDFQTNREATTQLARIPSRACRKNIAKDRPHRFPISNPLHFVSPPPS